MEMEAFEQELLLLLSNVKHHMISKLAFISAHCQLEPAIER
jgi:hypothetical protein